MATDSSEHGGINVRAAQGFAASSDYDKHRPSYPAASVEELLSGCRVAGKKGAKIVDLAAGTGKFTELLAKRNEEFEIIAIEPHHGMRDVLAAKQLPRVTVLSGKADAMPLEEASVDCVIAAQAFHWFANQDTLHEVHRVLRRHGVMGMIWNVEDYNAPQSHKARSAWESKVQNLTWTFNDKEPRFRHEQWRQVFDDQIKSTPMSLLVAADPLFALPIAEHHEEWEVWLERERLWERYNTLSHISVTQGEERARTKQTFMDAVHSSDVEANEKGEIALHGFTLAAWTSKVPAEGREGLNEVDMPGSKA